LVSGYAFDTSSSDERTRLALLEQCYDPATIATLTRLGVGDGWQCLEVGAGSGSIARWLRDVVRLAGRVVAVDLDTRFIDNEPRIDARQVDILTGDLGPGEFDLVHCRALLHHLPGKQALALKRMVGQLRPGGLLVAEEPYFGPMFGSPTIAWASTWRAYCAAMPTAHYEWAVALGAAIEEAELVEIEAAGQADVVQGGTPKAELLRLSLEG
jgi:SAM-dependent methyltransferase